MAADSVRNYGLWRWKRRCRRTEREREAEPYIISGPCRCRNGRTDAFLLPSLVAKLLFSTFSLSASSAHPRPAQQTAPLKVGSASSSSSALISRSDRALTDRQTDGPTDGATVVIITWATLLAVESAARPQVKRSPPLLSPFLLRLQPILRDSLKYGSDRPTDPYVSDQICIAVGEFLRSKLAPFLSFCCHTRPDPGGIMPLPLFFYSIPFNLALFAEKKRLR